MLKYLREHNKKILAVLGVFLMIAFIIPSTAKRGGFGGSGRAVGHMGKTPVTYDELRQAEEEWRVLTNIEGRLMRVQQSLPGMQLIGDHTTYFLLLREAQQMNVVPSAAIVNQLEDEVKSADIEGSGLSRPLTNLATILQAFTSRVQPVFKLSPALASYSYLDQHQAISLDMIPFRADEYRGKVAKPTAQQLREFFDKYKDKDQGSGDFGFGYRYPKRIRVQYLMIPRKAIRDAIPANGMDVYRAYLDQPSVWGMREEEPKPTTQPTTAPTTGPAVAAATTQPTTAPAKPPIKTWAEMTEKDKERIADALATAGERALAMKLGQIMAKDWSGYRQDPQANSSLGVPYDSPEYMAKLAEQATNPDLQSGVPSWHGVKPLANPLAIEQYVDKLKEKPTTAPSTTQPVAAATTQPTTLPVNPNALLAKDQLDELPGIGKAGLFPYMFAYYQPFLSMEEMQLIRQIDPQQAAMLISRPMQPSQPVRDSFGNLYIYRIAQAEPETTPANFESLPVAVQQRVESDYITFQAYELAKKDATACFDNVKKLMSGKEAQFAISDAAVAFKKQAIVTDEIKNDPNDLSASPKDLPLSSAALPQFLNGAFDLLHQRLTESQQHPARLIEVPRAATLVVAQLRSVKPAKDDGNSSLRMQAEYRNEVLPLALAWFNADAVRTRMQYKSETEEKRAPSQPQQVPIGPMPIGQ